MKCQWWTWQWSEWGPPQQRRWENWVAFLWCDIAPLKHEMQPDGASFFLFGKNKTRMSSTFQHFNDSWPHDPHDSMRNVRDPLQIRSWPSAASVPWRSYHRSHVHLQLRGHCHRIPACVQIRSNHRSSKIIQGLGQNMFWHVKIWRKYGENVQNVLGSEDWLSKQWHESMV